MTTNHKTAGGTLAGEEGEPMTDNGNHAQPEEFSLQIVGGDGTKRRLVVDTETGAVIDEDGISTGKTLHELALSTEFDLRVRAPIQQLNFDVVDDDDELPLIASAIKLKGGEYGVVGQWTSGMRARVLIEVEIESVSFDPLKTSLGTTYGLVRVHHAGKPDRVENPPV